MEGLFSMNTLTTVFVNTLFVVGPDASVQGFWFDMRVDFKTYLKTFSQVIAS